MYLQLLPPLLISTASLRGIAVLSTVTCLLLATQSSQPPEADKLVRIDEIDIRGTRWPADSVVRLSGLTIGENVNDSIVNAACHKITASGLVKTVDYGYAMYPDKPGVALTLTLQDETPLLPAAIQPEGDGERLWGCLASADPLFTRELPRTERALKYYSAAIEKCLKAVGRENEYGSAVVTGHAQGNARQIVFQIRKYR